jgi:hypothetical protein
MLRVLVLRRDIGNEDGILVDDFRVVYMEPHYWFSCDIAVSICEMWARADDLVKINTADRGLEYGAHTHRKWHSFLSDVRCSITMQ